MHDKERRNVDYDARLQSESGVMESTISINWATTETQKKKASKTKEDLIGNEIVINQAYLWQSDASH